MHSELLNSECCILSHSSCMLNYADVGAWDGISRKYRETTSQFRRCRARMYCCPSVFKMCYAFSCSALLDFNVCGYLIRDSLSCTSANAIMHQICNMHVYDIRAQFVTFLICHSWWIKKKILFIKHFLA